MAFKTPRLFPGSFCWEESEVDPLSIIDSPDFAPRKPYNFSCTLKQAMELYWIGQVYNLEGAMQYSTEGGSPIYSLTHSGLNQIDEGYWGFVDEMTGILCSDKGTRQNREGIKTQNDVTIIEPNSLALEIATNRQIGDTNYRIRKFEGKWYPLVTARIGDMAVGQFPYTAPEDGGAGTIELKFLDGSSVFGIGTNVSQIPSKVSGTMTISILTERQNS